MANMFRVALRRPIFHNGNCCGRRLALPCTMNPSGNCRVNTVSYSGLWWRKVLPPAVLVVAASLVLQPPDAAAAAGADCDALLEKAAKADEIPEIIIDSSTNSIRVRTSQGECVERLSAPTAPSAAPGPPETAVQAPQTAPVTPPAAPPVAVAPEPKAAPAAPPVAEAPEPAPAAPKTAEPGKPFKTHPYFRAQPMPPPRSLGGPQGETAKAPALSPAADCTTDLNSLWEKGEHDIRGTTYWLSQVFTIDLDGDRRIDNVGFRLKAADSPDLVIRYFADEDHLAARSVPTLKLDDEDVISRLCFGQASFNRPKPKGPKEELSPRAFETPDLEKEMMAKGKPAAAVTQAERGGVVSNGLWVAIAAFSGLVLAAASTGIYLSRRIWLPALKRLGKARRKDGGEEEDEEEEDEDAKEKK